MNRARRVYVTKRALRDRNDYDSPAVKMRRRAASVDSDVRSKPLTLYMAPVRRVRDLTLLKKKSLESTEINASSMGALNAFSQHGVPPEMIAHIMSFLPRKSLMNFALTCWHMKSIAYRCPNLWDNVVIRSTTPTASAIHSIVVRGARNLSISGCLIDDDLQRLTGDYRKSLDVWGSKSSLVQLEISCLAVPVSSDAVARIVSRSSSLVHLNIERVPLTTELAVAISKNPRLEKLNMCTCSQVTLENCKIIFEACSKLKELNISWTDIAPETLDRILAILPKTLLRLSLSNSPFVFKPYWSDVTNEILLTRCPDLIELDISDIFQRDSDSLFHLLKGLPKLQALHISRDSSIDLVSLFDLPKNITRLSAFNIFQYQEYLIDEIERQNVHLRINESPIIDIAHFTITAPIFKKPKENKNDSIWDDEEFRFLYDRPRRWHNF